MQAVSILCPSRGWQRSTGKESLYRRFQRYSEGGGRVVQEMRVFTEGYRGVVRGGQMNSEKERGVEKEKEWDREG